MALMYPDTHKARVIFSSRAEEVFYDACRAQLGDRWTVYFSRTLSTIERDKGLHDNEIDFVLYHPELGVLVLEVKGGRIRHDADSGEFFSINRYDESFRIKDPFQQALVWKSRFWRLLRNRNLKVPVSHAVVFPSVHENEILESASITPEIVVGRQKLKSLASALRNMVHKVQPRKYLKFDDVADDLHTILWGQAFTSKLYLKDYLASHDLRVKDIEVIQETLVQPIAASARLAVEGEAGTGKTLIALLLARYFRGAGKRVLILSSNRLLNAYLRNEVGANVDVKTYVEIGKDFGVHLLQPPADYAGKREDWIEYEAPEQLLRALQNSELRYDVLICDEAQDVQTFWWEALETLLDEADPRFYIFFDRSQGVFVQGGGGRGFEPESVLPIAQPYFPLVYNYRTTREIAGFSRAFRTGDRVMQSHCGRLGYIPEIVLYDDAQDCRGKLGRLFRKLFREEGVATDDVTLLSARNPNTPESVLRPSDVIARHGLRYLGDTEQFGPRATANNQVGLSTIAGFKGLETPIAVLLNISEYNLPLDNPIMASLIYVACTRAKHMLYVMVQRDDPKREMLEQALKQIRTTGAMVLEGSDANFEFVGTVSHYNPERIGWLEVSDPAIEKNSIMFFPHDARQAGIDDLQIGDRVRFRLQVEGQVTIAAELKRVDMEALAAAAEAEAEESGDAQAEDEIDAAPQNDNANDDEPPANGTAASVAADFDPGPRDKAAAAAEPASPARSSPAKGNDSAPQTDASPASASVTPLKPKSAARKRKTLGVKPGRREPRKKRAPD